LLIAHIINNSFPFYLNDELMTFHHQQLKVTFIWEGQRNELNYGAEGKKCMLYYKFNFNLSWNLALVHMWEK